MFRIYVKSWNRYSNFETLLNETGEVFLKENGFSINPTEYKVELFSGLLDANESPIYEGDIIKYTSYDDWFDKEGYETYGIVHFDKRYGTFTIWSDVVLHAFYKGSELYHFSQKSTVVGNVNQNPELVEKYFKNENKKD